MRLPAGTAGSGLGLACFLLVLLEAVSGAAATPEGALLAAPNAAGLALATATTLLLARFFGRRLGRFGVGLLPFLLALPFVGRLPGVAAWTGAPLIAPVLAVLVLLAWPSLESPILRRALVPSLFAVYALAAARVQSQVGPEGDEPHYLMVAESLLRDRDLELTRDYSERRYASFYRKAELLPHYRVRGKGGEIYSLHALGLSLLVLPAYALAGYAGASFFMALLLALLAREVRALLRCWLGETAPASATAWLVGLSPPLVHYAGLIFTEVPAALLLAAALRLGSQAERLRGRRLLALLLALAFLPWLNVRYALLSALLLLYALGRRPGAQTALRLVGGCAFSAAALGVHHFRLYGFFDPRRVYGVRPELSLAQLPEGLPGLLLDQEFGLLVYGPILAVGAAGLAAFASRERGRGPMALALLFSMTVLAGSWHMWRGGFNPPGRFLVPIVPVLAVGLGFLLRNGPSAPAAFLAGWSLWTGLAGAWEPRLVHRDRDGTAPFFRTFAGAAEWTRLLPGYVLSDPDRRPLALLWATALAGATVGCLRARPAGPGGLAVVGAAALALTACAAALSQAKTGGRDSVRVIGRPGIASPGLRPVAAAEARWDVAALGWGPVYEPHRHPEGAPIGERLELPSGRYRIVVGCEVLGEGMPDLVAGPRRAPFRAVRDGLAADLEVGLGDRPLTLTLLGGPSLIIKELRVEVSTFPP